MFQVTAGATEIWLVFGDREMEEDQLLPNCARGGEQCVGLNVVFL